MGNITDDIRQHFDTFAELPFTEADSLALSQLAYARIRITCRAITRMQRPPTA